LAAVAILALRSGLDPEAVWQRRWANARIERLTDFAGSEVDAAISADGRLVAFLADRDSVFDAFVGQVGTGQFVNLTGGQLPQLFNEDVRNIGFSADAAHVWIRVAGIASPASVSLVPTMGGPARPFLSTAVMAAWSPDGSRIAYHETTPGDPIFVADTNGENPQRLFIADPGVHAHHLSWSRDGRFLYFARGVPPNEMDVWRIAVNGGPPEQITRLNARVAYPVPLDDRTLVFTATADDGTGPWLYTLDLEDRIAHRWSTGVEHYISIAASTETPTQPRRLVATVSNPSVQLWTVPIGSGVADEQTATPVALPTARSAGPRFGPDSSLFYLASRGGADGVWRLAGATARELWKPPRGAVVGAVAVSPDGRRVCFPVRWQGRATLHCSNAEGLGVQLVAESLDVRGSASWSPDGQWIAVGAMVGHGVRVFKIPADGGPPVRLVDSVSSNPVWSPDGTFILYSGTPRARSVPLKAVTPDGQPYPIPPLAVDRVGDSYRFLPGGRQVVVKLGGFRRQDFWLFDVATGQSRQLTRLRPGESLLRFDVSPDGKRVLFERVRENSDVVLIELPRR
jgi:Tol biopolymer transport system component